MRSCVSTGWFGIPGGPEYASTKVHIVVDGKPACGARLSPAQRYQWCSHGIHLGYVECRRCTGMAQSISEKVRAEA